MSGKRIRILLFVAAFLVLVASLAIAYVKHAPRRTPTGQPPLAAIKHGDLRPFVDAFNASAGTTRVLLLLSPT